MQNRLIKNKISPIPLILITSFTILILSAGSRLFSGPTIIQDNRVTNLGTTPVLGRGYSISTNTFQSICLTNVTLTEPSYDFTYTFKSIESTEESQLQSQLDMKSVNPQFRDQMIKKLTHTGKTTLINNKKYYRHHIFVIINLHSYYASLDESKAVVSKSAAALLQKNDIPGFFSSCGSYYVRSIGRTAKFISIFTYSTMDSKNDLEFENQIEAQIKGFTKKGEDGGVELPEPSSSLQQSMKFKRQCSSKRLTITVAAFGLGKNEKATLISYDIATFKAAIKDAFMSMQNPRTGKVSSIEVIPWVENTGFQNLIRLEEETVVIDKTTKKTKKLLLYEKKQILNLNAEFLAELERIDRSLLNLYYKSKICRQYIDDNWKNMGSLKLEFSKKNVLNNQGGKSISLQKLDALLTQAKIDNILDREKNFMYGGPGYGKGAAICMKEMMSQGIFRTSYRDIKVCADLQKSMFAVDLEIVNNYCMPVLSTSGSR